MASGQRYSEEMELYESALVLPVRGMPTVLETLRLRYDPAAAEGISTHVTITAPFLPSAEINSKTGALLRQAAKRIPPFTSRFSEVSTFPQVVYLVPEDPTPYQQLLAAVLGFWPGYPPHGGRHGEYVPHLTLANGVDGGGQSELIERIRPFLPFEIFFNELHLVTRAGHEWRTAGYRLGPPRH